MVLYEILHGVNVRVTTRRGMRVRLERRRNPTMLQRCIGHIDPWWVDVNKDDPEGRWLWAAVGGSAYDLAGLRDGEHHCKAIGERLLGNPHGIDGHRCVPVMDPRLVLRDLMSVCSGLPGDDIDAVINTRLVDGRSQYAPARALYGIGLVAEWRNNGVMTQYLRRGVAV